jgi:hypothetical protein
LQLSLTEARLYYRSGTILTARNPAPDLTRAQQHNRNVRRYMLTHLSIEGLQRRVDAVRVRHSSQSPDEFAACLWYEMSLDLYTARLWFSQPLPCHSLHHSHHCDPPYWPPSPFTSDTCLDLRTATRFDTKFYELHLLQICAGDCQLRCSSYHCLELRKID